MALFIYGTVFNNADRVGKCIESLKPLNYKKIFVVDNYSTDGTYEILKNMQNVVVMRRKCSHGLGRQLALELALKEAYDEDFLMYVDFDTVYFDKYVNIIKEMIKKLSDNEVFIFGMLSKAKLNRSVPWRDLLTSEDLERVAHLKYLGYKIVMDEEKFDIVFGGKGLINPYYQNDQSAGDNFYQRHMRYKISNIQFMVRMFRVMIDNERGAAFKSLREFYSISSKKNIKRYFIFFIAYMIANLLGVYRYAKNKNNIEYIKDSLNTN